MLVNPFSIVYGPFNKIKVKEHGKTGTRYLHKYRKSCNVFSLHKLSDMEMGKHAMKKDCALVYDYNHVVK